MTSSELRDALAELDLLQVEFARIVEKSPRQVNRWCRGVRPVPVEIALLVRGWVAGMPITQ
jgi:DNA-binding transcriptional regulator YdaS (Cro superfamily)